MKFYEFEAPYCALIKASNDKEAIKKYTTEVCEDDKDEIEFHQITFEEAIEEIESSINYSPQDFFENWDSLVADKAKELLRKDSLDVLVDSSLF